LKGLELIDRKKIYSGKVFKVIVDELKYTSSGNQTFREVVVHPGGVVIAAETGNGKFIIVEQERYPIGKAMLEFPAGKLEPGENPLDCAVRELEEETGQQADEIHKLGSIYTSPGFCDEELFLFYARKLKMGTINREEGEQGMLVNFLTAGEIENKILSGEINDAKTISCFYRAMKFSRTEKV